MIEAILDPVRFFERRKADAPRPWRAYLVVLLAALIELVTGQLATRTLPEAPGPSSNPIVLALASVLASLLVWGLFGLLLHLFTGLGARAFELAGWLFVPGVVLGIVNVAVAALFPVTANLPPPPADPGALPGWLQDYQHAIQRSIYGRVSEVFNLLGSLWSAGLLYLGTRTFAPKRAALVTGLYLAITLLFFVLGWLKD